MGGRGKQSNSYFLHDGRQGKHIEGHNNFRPELNKSIITVSIDVLKKLFAKFNGKGKIDESGKDGKREIVDFGTIIGKVKCKDTGVWIWTTWGKIHFDQDGSWHIVPYLP